ncbi:MAG: type II secretion system protein [Planctomycetota bacterium]|jgi:hypothetical protein
MRFHRKHTQYAFTLLEFIIVLTITLLLAIILTFSLIKLRHQERIKICATNLQQLAVGFYTHGGDSSDGWPIAYPFPKPTKDEIGLVKYVGVIGKDEPTRGRANDHDYGSPGRFMIDNSRPPKELSTTRNFWAMVRLGAASPKLFICPSSDDVINNDNNPHLYWDFGFGDENKDAKGQNPWSQCSYGYQVPYGSYGSPNSDRQQDMPLAADKGPFSGAYEAGMTNPGTPTADIKSGSDQWAPWNSPNHRGEGQNILFADSHAEFFNKPIAGVANDNIYTRWSSAAGVSDNNDRPHHPRVQGTPPTSNEIPWSNTDSLIYP